MSERELIEKFSRETKERLQYDGFDIYFRDDSLHNEVTLEGSFTSEQLRVIAEQLDIFSAELAKIAANIG